MNGYIKWKSDIALKFEEDSQQFFNNFTKKEEGTIKKFNSKQNTTIKEFKSKQDTAFNAFDNKQNTAFKKFDNKQNTAFEEFENRQDSDFEKFKNRQDSDFKNFDNKQNTAFEEFENGQGIAFQAFDNKQNTAFEEFENGQGIAFQAFDNKQNTAFEEFENGQGIAFQAFDNKQNTACHEFKVNQDFAIKELETKLTNRATEFDATATEFIKKIQDLYGLAAEDTMKGGYIKNSDDNSQIANRLRTGFFVLIICAAVSAAVSTYVSPVSYSSVIDGLLQFLFRMPLTIIFAVGAYYCAKQSGIHRTRARELQNTALELQTVNPYLHTLPEHIQIEIKQAMAERLYVKSEVKNSVNKHLENEMGGVEDAIVDGEEGEKT